MPQASDPYRSCLLALFDAALSAVNGRRCMHAALAGSADRDVWLLAVGKAASAMTLGAMDALGPAVSRALVVSRAGHFDAGLRDRAGVRCVAGGHPLPDEGSLEAGAAALAMAREAPAGQRVLLLVSGGASSLLEVLPQGVSLQALRDLNRWALAGGVDIAAQNALRRRLSCVKDGRLLAAFAHCRVAGYFISDVPQDDPSVVGSGLLAAAPATAAPVAAPDWLLPLLALTPAAAPARDVPVDCVASLAQAIEAVRIAALAVGLPATAHAMRLQGDVADAAERVCHDLRQGPPGVQVYGGETTVRLPAKPGRGGRNQHLALLAAGRLEGMGAAALLACGTDGTDGNSEDAGAVVDGGTLQRGRDGGCDAAACLAAADSGRFLESSGDLVHTGPTGTNVGDLLIALTGDLPHSRPEPTGVRMHP